MNIRLLFCPKCKKKTAAVLDITLWQSVIGIFCCVREWNLAMKWGFYEI